VMLPKVWPIDHNLGFNIMVSATSDASSTEQMIKAIKVEIDRLYG
jgi:hypothetical protein